MRPGLGVRVGLQRLVLVVALVRQLPNRMHGLRLSRAAADRAAAALRGTRHGRVMPCLKKGMHPEVREAFRAVGRVR